MKFRENLLEIIEKMQDLLNASKYGMDKKFIKEEQVYKNLTTLEFDISRIETLIKREN